jgi:hypothetical protein
MSNEVILLPNVAVSDEVDVEQHVAAGAEQNMAATNEAIGDENSVANPKPYPKCNICILGHFESTHVGFKLSLYKDPTLNAIPAFWAISKVHMWGLNIFIRRSYPKCNTCILGHTTN